ncbi:unnamed protein product [Phytomonas sp. Hart1]|nr:unnamed protein product [Phytomonas sp. Hart1]|eukprot:CCW70296.1 unnamed protein product [Phytomonas sp. isolate Hart1]
MTSQPREGASAGVGEGGGRNPPHERARRLLEARLQGEWPRRESTPGASIPQLALTRQREILIRDFNAHLANCEISNRRWWKEVSARHAAGLAALTEERDTARAALAQLQEEQTSSIMALAALQVELEESHRAVANWSARCEGLGAENEQLKGELSDQANRFEELQKETQSTQAECSQAIEALANARVEYQKLRKQTADQVEELQHAFEEAHTLAASLEIDRTQSNKLLEDEKAMVAHLLGEIEVLEQKVNSRAEEIVNVNFPFENLFLGVTDDSKPATEVAASHSTADLNAVEKALQSANQIIVDLHVRLEGTQSALAESRAARDHHQREVNDLKALLEVKCAERERLAAALLLSQEPFELCGELHQTLAEPTEVASVSGGNPFSAFDDLGGESMSMFTPSTSRVSLVHSNLISSRPQDGLPMDQQADDEIFGDEQGFGSYDEEVDNFANDHSAGSMDISTRNLSDKRPENNPFVGISLREEVWESEIRTNNKLEDSNFSNNLREPLSEVKEFHFDSRRTMKNYDAVERQNEFRDSQDYQCEEKNEEEAFTNKGGRTELNMGVMCKLIEGKYEVQNLWLHKPRGGDGLEVAPGEPLSSFPEGGIKRSLNTDFFQGSAFNTLTQGVKCELTSSKNDLPHLISVDREEGKRLCSAAADMSTMGNYIHKLERQLETLQLRLNAYEHERSQPFPEMEEIRRKYAETQHRLLMAERENAELALQLATMRSRTIPMEGLGDVRGGQGPAIGTSVNADNCLAAAGEIGHLGNTADSGTLGSFPLGLALGGTNDISLFGDGSGSGVGRNGHHWSAAAGEGVSASLPACESHFVGGVRAGRIPSSTTPCAFEDLTGGGAGDEGSKSLQPTRHSDELMSSALAMEDLGHRYADAQHRLTLSEEARSLLESEVQELRTRVEDLGIQLWEAQQGIRPTNEALPSVRSTEALGPNPFLDILPPIPTLEQNDGVILHKSSKLSSFQALIERFESVSGGDAVLSDEFQRQLEELKGYHDQELEDLAENAAAQIAELEATYTQRITNMEDEMRDLLSRQDQGASSTREDGRHQPTSTSNEARDDDGQDDKLNTQSTCIQSLNDALTEMKGAVERFEVEHEADLQAVAQAIDIQLLENDKILERRLEQQRIFYEGHISDLEDALKQQQEAYFKLETESASAVRALSDNAESQAAYWRDEHSKLSLNFQKLLKEYEGSMHNLQTLQEHKGQTQHQEELNINSKAAFLLNPQLQDRPEDINSYIHVTQDNTSGCDVQFQVTQGEFEKIRTQCTAQVTHLEETLEKRMKEIEHLTQSNDELGVLLKGGASTMQTKLQDQQEQIESANLRVHQLEEELSRSQDELVQCANMIELLKGTEKAAQEQVLSAVAIQRDLSTQLHEAKRRVWEEQHAAAQKLQSVVRELEQKEEQVKYLHTREIEDLQKQLESIRVELEVPQTMPTTFTLEDEKFELVKQRLTDALVNNDQLQASLRDASAEIQVLHGVVDPKNSSQRESTTSISSNDAPADSLLQHIMKLEFRIKELTNDRSTLEDEKAELENNLKDAVSKINEKEKILQRQKIEIQNLHHQLLSIQENLEEKTREHQHLSHDLSLVQENSIQLATAYEELQSHSINDAHYITAQKHMEALLMAKMICVPLFLQEYLDAIFGNFMLLVVPEWKQRHLLEQCDTVDRLEKGEILTEVALVDAHQAKLSQKKID